MNRRMLNCVPLARRRAAESHFSPCGEKSCLAVFKEKGLENNRSVSISSWLDPKGKPQYLGPGPSQPQTYTCVLISAALFCCCSGIEQKFWGPWSYFAHVTGIGYYLILSAFLFLYESAACCCFLFRQAWSTQPWKSFSGYWSEYPYEPGSLEQGTGLS